MYGVVTPRQVGALTVKAVGHRTARLLKDLRDPALVPLWATRETDSLELELRQLVLDEVLEIEWHGEFVTGPSAQSALAMGTDPLSGSRQTDLSINALKYAQSLRLGDAAQISQRLYFYNRYPISPRWTNVFTSDRAVGHHLGIDRGRVNDAGPGAEWKRIALRGVQATWALWKSSSFAPPATETETSTYKLYVSPTPDRLKETLAIAVDEFASCSAFAFKIGAELRSILRPDKLIAYFSTQTDMAEAAQRISVLLPDSEAHSVPFTAQLCGDPRLSWGMDPPRSNFAAPWLDGESWRLWVANRLGLALHGAQSATKFSTEPWEYALERLRLDGVDTGTWAPTNTADFWKSKEVS